MRITTTQLKVITTLMMVICFGMLVAWPLLLGERPGPAAPRIETKAFAVRFVSYISFMVLALLIAAASALGILRRTAAEYREQQMDNMRELIESTLKDTQRGTSVNHEPTVD
jgi:hypothetical protein